MRDKPLSNENKVSQMAIYAVKNGCTVITTKESPHIGIGRNNVQPPFLPIAFLFFFFKRRFISTYSSCIPGRYPMESSE